MKKLFAGLLTACLLLTSLPAMARAAAPPDSNDVCSIGNTGYPTLTDALEAGSSGDTIRIIADITLANCLKLDKDITLTSENGSKLITQDAPNSQVVIKAGTSVTFCGNLVVQGDTAPVVSVDGSLTLTGNVSVKQTNTSPQEARWAIVNDGTVTVAGNAVVEGTYGGIFNNEGKTLTIEGGTVIGKNFSINSNGILTISNGTIGSVNGSTSGIYLDRGASAVITGGKVYASHYAVTVAAGGVLEISGGEFAVSLKTYDVLHSLGTTTLKGGNFTTGKVSTFGNGRIHIDRSDTTKTLTLSQGVQYTEEGSVLNNYLLSMPDSPMEVLVGDSSQFRLNGAAAGVALTVGSGTSPELAAAETADPAILRLSPTAAGNYTLAVKAAGTGTAGGQFLTLTLPVAVRTPVCEINGKGYASLDAAVIDAGARATIRLLRDITHTKPVVIDGQDITFDLNGFDLTIDTSAENGSAALELKGESTVDYTGDGSFRCIGNSFAIRVDEAASMATISYAETTRGSAYTVHSNGGRVAVKGDVLSRSGGNNSLWATGGGHITVEGTVTGSGTGIYAYGELSEVKVKNGVTMTGSDGTGVIARNGGRVEITGNVTAGERGVIADMAPLSYVKVTGNVIVAGDVSGAPPHDIEGVAVGAGATAHVTGNVTVSGIDCTGVYANTGAVRIDGNVTSAALGAEVSSNGGTITIEGTMTAAGTYVKVRGVAKRADECEARSAQPGYKDYRNGASIVWVKEPPILPDDEPAPRYWATVTNSGKTFKIEIKVSKTTALLELAAGGKGIVVALPSIRGVTSYRLSIPYTPAETELKNLAGITAFFIDGAGKQTEVEGAKFDPETKCIVFQTTMPGIFSVGYKHFSDVPVNAWYFTAVSFLAEKGITTGVLSGTFHPEEPLTRAQFLVMLLRAYGVASDTNLTDNFADAGSTYYTGYLAAAKRLGISKGVGENRFGPEQPITRQELFTLLYNALKHLNKLPNTGKGKTFTDFTDSGDVASWAHEALAALVKAGVIEGSDGKLTPAAATTRAQMAQILYNLLK